MFYEISFDEFIEELNKQKINLSNTQLFSLMELYSRKVKKIKHINIKIITLEIEFENLARQSLNIKEDEVLLKI